VLTVFSWSVRVLREWLDGYRKLFDTAPSTAKSSTGLRAGISCVNCAPKQPKRRSSPARFSAQSKRPQWRSTSSPGYADEARSWRR
jgi:hypothetical protein